MKKIAIAVLVLCAGLLVPILAAERKAEIQNAHFVLADKAKGKELLLIEDDFTNALTPFDMSARLKTAKSVTKKQYFDFIKEQTLDWQEDEKNLLNGVFTEIKNLLKDYKIEVPEIVYLVKTTGHEEGNSAYCRNLNVIVFAQSMLNIDKEDLSELCLHELFHIYSRNNLDVREKLYNHIGFYKTGKLSIPDNINKNKITNPDAPANNYYFKAEINGEKTDVMPLLLATGPYDETKGGEFFNYMRLLFFAVDTGKDECTLHVENEKYAVFPLSRISNYFEKVGKNTEYIIHAEEILADNFVILAKDKKDIQSPYVIDGMKSVLKNSRTISPARQFF